MLKIFKYYLPLEDYPEIQLPSNTTILRTGQQKDKIMLWALVDPDTSLVKRHFRIYVTGETIDTPKGQYIGSAEIKGGAEIYHIFEI